MSLRRVIVVVLLAIVLLRPPLRVAGQEPITVDGTGYDWSYPTCHALDPGGDLLDSTPDWYDSRDLLAWYYAVGSSYVYVRVDLMDLAYGAEIASYGSVLDALNIYILLGWSGAPGYQAWVPDYVQYNGAGVYLTDYHWVIAIAVYDTQHYRVYRYDWAVLAENTGLKVAFNSQWDIVEVAIPTSMLSQLGWTPTTRVWAKVATTLVKSTSSGAVSVLADVMPNSVYMCSNGACWSGALFSDAACGTAKLMIVHHGNQHLTDNRALNNQSSRNSYRYVLYLHDLLSNLTGRKIPVNIHVSGTLLASWLWWEPGMVSYVKALMGRGVVDVVGGVWAEYITAYFYDNFNSPSASYALEYYQKVLGATPKVAWIPERTWDDERTGIASTISKYYKAVILDGNTHHDDWITGTSPTKPHKYDTTKTGGRTLYVFFIDWDTQQLLLANTDGGLNKALRAKYISAATSPDQQQVFVYADDWEKAAGIAGWNPSGIDGYENSLRWIAQHPWIQVVSGSDLVSWLDTGSWAPVSGYYCGYDTYLLIKQWVQSYPYDYRRAYDGWYWGTPKEEAFSQLGPNLWLGGIAALPMGDVFGYTSYSGSPDNTILYKLLRPGGVFDSVPKNEFWRLSLVTLNAMLYETAWHDEGLDYNGNGQDDLPWWGRTIWSHVRQSYVLLQAAKWLDSTRSGSISGVGYTVGDFDFDGRNEVIVYNKYLFVFVDDVGGAVPYVLVYVPEINLAYMGAGAPMVYWTSEYDYWYGASQVGLFVDDYYTATGKNYYKSRYTISVSTGVTSTGVSYVRVALSAPDLNGDGKPDFTKYIVVYAGARYIDVYYSLPSGGTVYLANGLSVDPMTTLVYGDVLSQVGSPTSTYSFGFKNNVSRAYAYVTPLYNAQHTGSQDLKRYTLHYVWKMSATNGAKIRATFTYSG